MGGPEGGVGLNEEAWRANLSFTTLHPLAAVDTESQRLQGEKEDCWFIGFREAAHLLGLHSMYEYLLYLLQGHCCPAWCRVSSDACACLSVFID